MELTKEALYDLYITRNLPVSKVAEYFSVGRKVIQNRLSKFGIAKTQEQIAECRRKSNIEKYGVENPSQAESVKAKKSNPFNDPAIQQKIRETNRAKYGVENPMQAKAVREKAKTTNLKKYGCTNPSQAEEIKQKKKSTLMEHYGVENYQQSAEAKQKVRERLTEKYRRIAENIGVKYSESLSELIVNYSMKFQTENCRKPTVYDFCKAFEYSESLILQNIKLNHLENYIEYMYNFSSYELEIYEFLKFIGIENIIRNDRTLITPHELDFYLPDYNLAIEFNGDYFHSDLFRDRLYHQQKALAVREKGCRLISIYEYERNDPDKQRKLKSIIATACGKVSNIIPARKCQIQPVANTNAKSFIDTNHLQGYRSANITYGLYYNDELVELMSFSKTKYNRNLIDENSREIIRSCTRLNTIVIGGTAKIFRHFIRDNNPEFIFSYCDFNKFSGKSYETIGMQYAGITQPDVKYIIDRKVVNRNPSKNSEQQSKKQATIYGAGSLKYIRRNL